MSTPLQVYQRVLKLPCDDLRGGMSFKTTLDAGLKQVIGVVFKPSDGFKVQLGADETGQLQATASRGSHTIQLQGRYGKNSVFAGGQRSSFISYTIRAEGSLDTLNRAENIGSQFVVFGRVTGALVVFGGVFGVLGLIPHSLDLLTHSVPLFAMGLIGGQWLGAKVGRSLANRYETRAENRSLATHELEKADAIWGRFTGSISTVISGYSVAK